MNYFRCTVGGSGKGNAVTVTCAEEFAGLTITLSKTGKTYTKTCPSTSPYVVTFYGVENGTYTVSATYDGRTYSESVVVKNIDCVLNYGFGWVTWVNTAQYLDASDYASLDEVLEDEAAIRELFLEHACVDYMAEAPASNIALQTIINNDLCAKWINLSDYALDYLYANEVIADLMDEADKYGYGEWALMPQIPRMTSNTAPYGTAFGNGSYTDNPPYYCFDGNDSTLGGGIASASTSGAFIGYHFINPICVKRIAIKVSYAYPTQCIIQASNNGTAYTDLKEFTIVNSDGLVNVDFANENKYSYYRIYQKSTTTAHRFGTNSLQFYAWAPKGNVPVMTSDSAPYGEVNGSLSASSGSGKWKAFDGDVSTAYIGSSSATSAYVQYKFTNPVNVKAFMCYYASHNVTSTIQISYSDDGSTFTNAGDTFSYTSSDSDKKKTYKLDDDYGYHLYWRFTRGRVTAAATVVNELQFYGRELKVSVPKMTSNTAPYGQAFQYKGNFQSEDAAQTYKAFDGNSSTNNYITNTQGSYYVNPSTSYIGYKFTQPVRLKTALIDKVNWAKQSVTNNIVVEASNDGQTWEAISNEIAFAHLVSNNTPFTITSDSTYTYFRVRPTTSNTAYMFVIDILQFYGVDYSEKEFEVGTTKKWLYDHGVELEPMEVSANGTSVATKNTDSLYIKLAAADNQYARFNTENTIDLTDYSLVRYILGEKLSGDVNPAIAVGSSKLTNSSWTGIVAESEVDNTKPYTNSLNISAVSQSLYVEMARRNSATTKNCERTVTELWLE